MFCHLTNITSPPPQTWSRQLSPSGLRQCKSPSVCWSQAFPVHLERFRFQARLAAIFPAYYSPNPPLATLGLSSVPCPDQTLSHLPLTCSDPWASQTWLPHSLGLQSNISTSEGVRVQQLQCGTYPGPHIPRHTASSCWDANCSPVVCLPPCKCHGGRQCLPLLRATCPGPAHTVGPQELCVEGTKVSKFHVHK